MKPKLPSPAMVVAIMALLVALSGTAVAAVNFASNAGAVDGKSAVASSASLNSAAGKLVATQRSGAGKGRLAAKFLDLPRVGARKRRDLRALAERRRQRRARPAADRLGARHRSADGDLQGRERRGRKTRPRDDDHARPTRRAKRST